MGHPHKVIVVGGGLAGMRAAIAAHDAGARVAVLTKVYAVRSHSGAAQGGVNAALGNHPDGKDDSPERHAYDTVKGSDYLADQDAVEVMTREAPHTVIEMEGWGCPFSRFDDGRIAQRPFGGGGFPRTCYATDRTGHVMLHTLFEQCVKRQIEFINEWQLIAIGRTAERVVGIVAADVLSGELRAFPCQAVVLATGGYGRIYGRSTNAVINTGSGMGIAYRAGVPLKDMEFVQFHPTSLVGTNILMTEGCRGEGGYLRNRSGERFMFNYVSMDQPELAPRDIVSRCIQTEINEGRGFEGGYVHLDLTHLGRDLIMERLPGIREICIQFAGIDPIDKPIPIQPGQHYSMGGIDVDPTCACPHLPGLYAAGEAACVSVHGANRLGGNSLLETVVFGAIAGQSASQYVSGREWRDEGDALGIELHFQSQRVRSILESHGTETPGAIRAGLKDVMIGKAGIFRTAADLSSARWRIGELRDQFNRIRLSYKGWRYNLDLLRALELEHKLELAETIALGALTRTESRGSHYRVDHPKRNDADWLHHTLAWRQPDGSAGLDKKAVTMTKWQPEERKY